MQLTRLRLAGFKTFVEAADVPIEPGLTGIVGPNGCGKSNLVEALRWAMGESSHRSLRATEMDDVIFAGSAGRPARNAAEVVLKVDNAARLAPAAFNGSDEIEVVRRILRGVGSTWRINGREARARDVQILFADASTGPRSPALIGQGRVAELVNARPDQRRRLLEEAAGIAGLNARRGEAEIRLRAAESNLERVEDHLAQLDGRIDGLRRQGRAATRYRQLSAELRRLEAIRLVAGWREASAQLAEAERAAAAAEAGVAEAARDGDAAAHAEAAAELEAAQARQAAAVAAAEQGRLAAEAGALRSTERDARARTADLDRQTVQADLDTTRERQLRDDAAGALKRVCGELAALPAAAAEESAEAPLVAQAAAATAALAEAEQALAETVAADAERSARRAASARARDGALMRVAALEREAERIARETAGLDAATSGPIAALEAELAAALIAAATAEAAAQSAETAATSARAAETAARAQSGEAETRAATLAAEAATLTKLLEAGGSGAARRIIDRVAVEPGYEQALGAALGEDLQAGEEPSAPLHWLTIEGVGADPALPVGAEPLATHVRAPAALARRLAQIGVVGRADGAALRGALAPGQRLVSREGDLWRWDGFTVRAEAETAAARRLAERNRLDAVGRRARDAEAAAARLRAATAAAQTEARAAADAGRAAQEAWRAARGFVERLRDRLAGAERAAAADAARRAALAEAAARVAASLVETQGALAQAEGELAPEPAAPPAGATLAERRGAAAQARVAAAGAASALEGHRRAQAEHTRRKAALGSEQDGWAQRKAGAQARLDALALRRGLILAERGQLAQAADAAEQALHALAHRLARADAAAGRDADRVAAAERARTAAAEQARAAQDRLARAREARARTDERLLGARKAQAEAAARLQAAYDEAPAAVAARIDIRATDLSAVEAALARLTRDRERLGPVNLAAESELAEVEASRASLAAERDDIVGAIRELRRAILTLNQEGRARLVAAFDRVDGNFRRLFSTLFGGGEARLELLAAEDPLEAGLEVHARPPGKRAHTLSLLSGGEQALTALALVFAVFLTNPAPLCVLDEVDAPLDDANVERFCNLLDATRAETETRFLVVTHNPITMSRMDRLIGVTMAERGVSQLVAVALDGAERLRETAERLRAAV